MSGTGAVVDVVSPDHRAKKFLHLVGILIDAARGTDSSYGIRTVLGDDLLELGHNQVQGLIPGSLAELTVLSDQRCPQTVMGVDKVISEAALDAQPAVVGSGALDRCNLSDSPVVDMEP
jgi:hypothetical protein